MCPDYRLRRATPSDLETIVAFTLEEAREAERVEIEADGVRRGVQAGLEDPALSTYWVAESSDGQNYWWVQSLFIIPEHRGRGLVDLLLDEVAEEARAAGAVDLRLYAHGSNQRALEAYRRCGFDEMAYVIMRRRLADD
jgi:ribosomal protein S18 acetylase RimI-like enzyme